MDLQGQLGARADAGDLTREDGPAVRLPDGRTLATEYYQCRGCDAVWRLTAPPGALIEMMRAGSASGVPVVREPISMFADSVTLSSPDGRFTATMTGAAQVEMGAPTRGTLQISNGIVRDDCNPSIVWSDDSQFLAASEIVDHGQPARVLVFSMSRGEARYAPGQYRGLELQSFSQGSVRATDGEKAIEIDVSGIAWDAPVEATPHEEPPCVEAPSPVAPPEAIAGPIAIAAPIVVAEPVVRRDAPPTTRVPRGCTIVNDELRLLASRPSSFDGPRTAIVVVGATLLLWVLVFIANRAGLPIQNPIVLGGLVLASLAAVGCLAFPRGRWRVVFDRSRLSVHATRFRSTLGPIRFAPGLLSVRPVPARPEVLVTLRIGTVDLTLASESATDAAVLREAIVAWMTPTNS
jgi:hypothetical protein